MRAALAGQRALRLAAAAGVVLAGDARLIEKLRREDSDPLGSRIRTRLATEHASREELIEGLAHLLTGAGNATLMTQQLRHTLCDHAAGNYRILTTMAAELLAVATKRELPQLDEKLYLEVFAQPDTSTPRRAADLGVEQARNIMTPTARMSHAHPIALPMLSDETVVEIRNFIEHVLDQFDIHYAAARRSTRTAQSTTSFAPPRPPPTTTNNPPF